MMSILDVERATQRSGALPAQLLLCEPTPSAMASISESTLCNLDLEPFYRVSYLGGCLIYSASPAQDLLSAWRTQFPKTSIP